ncbi:MAG: AAA family ATPase [Patescibacteria group bacterium]|nr:AAA family ATPase [Patescibacteria group bacterium]MDD5490880.1 AAA family ATPase [Patescibacteria group bacterium]
MYLEKLEIQGFKSFAEKTMLEFRPPQKDGHFKYETTGIVGPNGSGKSNIADAVRWVLGEQSIKTIRGKKSVDVIFSGSDKKARLGFAEVHLYLNNADRQAPIEYQQLILGRRLYRNGESEYLINKNKARLQDILLLLAKSNMGQRTYSVIGQGMVDSVLLATPQERKELFDEAAGIKQYQIKRDQSLNKLEASEDNLLQAESLLLEIEPRMRSLTRQVRRLERRAEVEQELKDKQTSYYGSLWQEITKQYNKQKITLSAKEQEQQKNQEGVRAIQTKLNSLEKEETQSSAFIALQREYEKIIEEKNKLREQELLLKNKVELAKRMQDRLPEIMPLEEVIETLEQISGLQNKLLEKIRNAKDLVDLEAIKYQTAEITEKSNDLLEKLKNPQKTRGVKIDPALLANIEKISQQITALNSQIAEVQKKMTNFQKEEEQKKGRFFDLQREFQEKQMALNRITNEVNDIKIELARLETKREDLENEMKEELKDYETVISQSEKINTPTNREELWPEIQRLKHQLELIGGIDEETVQEYKETKERYDFLSQQSADLKKAINDLEKVIEELDETIKKQFDSAFNNINNEFEKFFRILFNGGKANLIKITEEEELKNKEEELKTLGENAENEAPATKVLQEKKRLRRRLATCSAIEIHATPPGKKLKGISMLSGGERALTSIALICAIIYHNPAPFVLLDEVDAALDESNSIRFAEILAMLSEKTQFIVITHNRYTMEKCGILYGVTMGDDGVSRLLSMKLEEAAQLSSK